MLRQLEQLYHLPPELYYFEFSSHVPYTFVHSWIFNRLSNHKGFLPFKINTIVDNIYAMVIDGKKPDDIVLTLKSVFGHGICFCFVCFFIIGDLIFGIKIFCCLNISFNPNISVLVG